MSICYFTYSWEKDSQIEESLKMLLSYMKNQIELLSNGDVKVIYDKESFEKGKNFKDLEKQIKVSDSILLFFTPEYKHKVEAKNADTLDTGVYREYQMIKDRVKSDLDGIIPILLSGTKDSAVTDEFKDIIHWDISKVRNQISKKHGKVILGDELGLIIKKIVRKAIQEARAVSYCKDYEYLSLEEEYRALFLDSSITPLPQSCIIKTTAYDQIITQKAHIVLGRKGSGKSTLLNAIQKYNPQYFLDNYKELKSMDIEGLDMSFIYETLIEQSRKEFNLISMSKIIDTFWEIVFILQGMITIGCDIEKLGISPDDSRYSLFVKVTNKLKKLLGIQRKRKLSATLKEYAVSHCAVELLTNHINNKLLTYASEQSPFTAAYNSVDAYSILITIFGERDFRYYCAGVKQCRKKIFFAIDGFDTHSEDFRAITTSLFKSNVSEYKERKEFEIKFFRELLLSISNVKKKEQQPALQDFFTAMHFCVILPQDRYDEIALNDRDIAKRNYCTLNWDAYDLLEMLVKRLEHYYRIENEQSLPLNVRFDNIIRERMPNIPTEISIMIDGFERKIPLFNYILRLSFWRPRDIIKNFAMVIKISNDEDSINEYAENVIKKFLVRGAKNIIEDEFINEYKNVYLNIKDILFRFRETDLIQTYSDFCERLSKISIQAVAVEDYVDIDSKLTLLYKLGIIGLYFEESTVRNNGYGCQTCFSFNEGLDPIEDFISIKSSDIRTKIIFNPIFAKYLSLNYNTNDIICNYSWDYIKSNHASKDDIRRI